MGSSALSNRLAGMIVLEAINGMRGTSVLVLLRITCLERTLSWTEYVR